MLLLAATPLGNLKDASVRLREQLATASYIAAEDTRVLRRLASGLGITINAEIQSFHDFSKPDVLRRLVKIAETHTLLLVSDAGMPAVADPGFELVQACLRAGVEVSIIPGPSAGLSALVISGLPTNRFTFEGFIARTPSARRRQFRNLSSEERTMIFYDSANRIRETLSDAVQTFGENRKASISRELTKKFEETVRGTLLELKLWAETKPKGELVLVIGGNEPSTLPDLESESSTLIEQLRNLTQSGMTTKDAVSQLSVTTGYRRADLYRLAIAAKL